ncbi:MAG: D-alanyl-D-alanine carboxypeptidase family protein [Verrucomicrobiales bacterium]
MRILSALVSIWLLAGLSFQGQAQESFIAVDGHAGKVLVEFGADRKVQVPGLVKIATGVVALDWAKVSGTDLGTMVPVPNTVTRLRGANPLGLQPGDQISLRDALYSMLLGADDAAATTVATYVGYRIQQQRRLGGVPEAIFVTEMNNLASWLGMSATRFGGPSAATNGRGGSTARDMARMSIYAMKHQAFVFFAKQQKRTITFVRGGEKKSFQVRNTNEMVGRDGVIGVAAGGPVNAAVHSQRKSRVVKLANGTSQVFPREVTVVVLGSANRFGRAASLFQQAWPRLEAWQAQGMPLQGTAQDVLKVPNPK